MFPHLGTHMALKVSASNKKSCVPEFSMLPALNSCGLLILIDMNRYILTEGRNFKTFLKKMFAFAWDINYIFTKKVLIMEMSMILIVLMEFEYIRHSRTLR